MSGHPERAARDHGEGQALRGRDRTLEPGRRRGALSARMARFFVDRPIVAIVIAIVTVILRPGVDGRPADRAVPRDHPAPDPDQDHLHRRRRGDHRAVGRDAARAADERRRQDALHAVDQRQRRHDDADRHLRRRDRSQHRPGQRAEPRLPGRSRTCPPTSTSSASRIAARSACRWWWSRSTRRTAPTTRCSSATTRTSTSTTRSTACRASARSSSSARPSTRCGSG